MRLMRAEAVEIALEHDVPVAHDDETIGLRAAQVVAKCERRAIHREGNRIRIELRAVGQREGRTCALDVRGGDEHARVAQLPAQRGFRSRAGSGGVVGFRDRFTWDVRTRSRCEDACRAQQKGEQRGIRTMDEAIHVDAGSNVMMFLPSPENER
ncbi:hypothetical protein [Burkholderia ambifaria]|uniref:hypothetical protein n=1 Tax=Burkholderia ambifaria TaxID=152480 RepID=UPI0030B86676